MRLPNKVATVAGPSGLADGGITPAKGDPGTLVIDALCQPVQGTLTLHHSHNGPMNREARRTPK